MTEIKCPNDLNQFILGEPAFENQFPEEECEQKKFYGDCYHCFSTAIASRDHQLQVGRDPGKCGHIKVIDADKFLAYLIFSKHIDELTCGEVKEAIEMCKVDILDKIRAEIEQTAKDYDKFSDYRRIYGLWIAIDIIDKYRVEREDLE